MCGNHAHQALASAGPKYGVETIKYLYRAITPGAHQYLYSAHAGDQYGMDDAAIYKFELDGRLIGRFGKAGKQMTEFGLVNAIDCRFENVLFVGELTNWRVQKLTLHPSPPR